MSIQGSLALPHRPETPTSRRRHARPVDAGARRTRLIETPGADESPARTVTRPMVASEAAWSDTGSPPADVLQRLFDIIAALTLLVVSGPLWIAIAAVNRVTGAGPTFYTQERVGQGGRRFRILKFRSMRLDAERETGPVFAREGDTRCTAFGGWLRRSCLDELPQLWNVLRGEMSLVGPRPERPLFVEEFRLRLPRYDLRHRVRPGITGWAQVNGWRGCTSISERLRFDLEYVRRRSLLFDLRILLLTPAAVMFPNRMRRLEFGWDHLVHPATDSPDEADRMTVGHHDSRAA